MKKIFISFGSMVATLIIAGSLFTLTVHAQVTGHIVVTSNATPTINSSVVVVSPTSTIMRYDATFTVGIVAVDSNVILGLPDAPIPAFNVGAPSTFLFKNSVATDYHSYNPIVSYSVPTGAGVLNSKYFMITKGTAVTVPVTYSFRVINPGANSFGVRLAGLMYSTATSSLTATSSFQMTTFPDMCTIGAVCTTPPANPIVAPLMSLSPNSVVSGGTSVMSFVIPSDMLRAPLTMVCPAGLTATIVSSKLDLCSGKPFYAPVNSSQYSVQFTNSTPLAITINPSVTVTYTDHAGESRTASALITVVPNVKQQAPSALNLGFKNVAANTIDAAAGFLSALRSIIFGN